MEQKKRLAYSLLSVGIAFVGVLHVVFSTIFQYGFRQVGALLIVAGLFGLLLINA